MFKKLFMLALGLWFSNQTFAQQTLDLPENKPQDFEGLEIGYNITNEQSKDDYSRYEVTVYITNRTGCNKFYLKDERFTNVFSSSYTEPGVIAVFDCLNATGRRLTSKSSTVKAKPFYINASVPETKDGKTTNRDMRVQGGFALRNSDSVMSNFIVILPLNERPKFKCRVINASEL